MKFLLPVLVNLIVSIVKPCQLSSVTPKENLCIIAGVILQSSGLPSSYEVMEKYEEDSSDESNEVTRTTFKDSILRPTTTTEETGVIKNEWRKRGEYRIICVDEVGVIPSKVVNLMSGRDWTVSDVELKKWALCVLNKMNLMSQEGVFKLDVAMSKIADKDKADAEALIDHCLPTQTMKPYEIAWTYVKCHNKDADRDVFSSINVF